MPLVGSASSPGQGQGVNLLMGLHDAAGSATSGSNAAAGGLQLQQGANYAGGAPLAHVNELGQSPVSTAMLSSVAGPGVPGRPLMMAGGGIGVGVAGAFQPSPVSPLSHSQSSTPPIAVSDGAAAPASGSDTLIGNSTASSNGGKRSGGRVKKQRKHYDDEGDDELVLNGPGAGAHGRSLRGGNYKATGANTGQVSGRQESNGSSSASSGTSPAPTAGSSASSSGGFSAAGAGYTAPTSMPLLARSTSRSSSSTSIPSSEIASILTAARSAARASSAGSAAAAAGGGSSPLLNSGIQHQQRQLESSMTSLGSAPHLHGAIGSSLPPHLRVPPPSAALAPLAALAAAVPSPIPLPASSISGKANSIDGGSGTALSRMLSGELASSPSGAGLGSGITGGVGAGQGGLGGGRGLEYRPHGLQPLALSMDDAMLDHHHDHLTHEQAVHPLAGAGDAGASAFAGGGSGGGYGTEHIGLPMPVSNADGLPLYHHSSGDIGNGNGHNQRSINNSLAAYRSMNLRGPAATGLDSDNISSNAGRDGIGGGGFATSAVGFLVAGHLTSTLHPHQAQPNYALQGTGEASGVRSVSSISGSNVGTVGGGRVGVSMLTRDPSTLPSSLTASNGHDSTTRTAGYFAGFHAGAPSDTGMAMGSPASISMAVPPAVAEPLAPRHMSGMGPGLGITPASDQPGNGTFINSASNFGASITNMAGGYQYQGLAGAGGGGLPSGTSASGQASHDDGGGVSIPITMPQPPPPIPALEHNSYGSVSTAAHGMLDDSEFPSTAAPNMSARSFENASEIHAGMDYAGFGIVDHAHDDDSLGMLQSSSSSSAPATASSTSAASGTSAHGHIDIDTPAITAGGGI